MPAIITSATTDDDGTPAAPLLDSLFSNPCAVAVDPATGDVAVADGRVWVVSTDRERAFSLADDHEAAVLLRSPSGVAFDGDRGLLLVTDRETHRLLAFKRDSGAFAWEIGQGRGVTAGRMLEPLAVVVHEGVAVVAEGGPTDRLQAFDIATGQPLWTYPSSHDGDDDSTTTFATPTALAIDAPRRLLWVADSANGVRAFGIGGSGGPQLLHEITDGVRCPRGLAVCRRGLLHVTDARGYTVYERVVADDGATILHIPVPLLTDFFLVPDAGGVAEARDGSILVCRRRGVAVLPPVQLAGRREEEEVVAAAADGGDREEMIPAMQEGATTTTSGAGEI